MDVVHYKNKGNNPADYTDGQHMVTSFFFLKLHGFKPPCTQLIQFIMVLTTLLSQTIKKKKKEKSTKAAF